MNAAPSSSLPREPRQGRSRRTEERIVSAALSLLGTKPIEQWTVAEIAGRAGVSVGGFYARFPSKDALFEHFYGVVVESLGERVREALSPEATVGRTAREVVRRYLEIAVAGFREHAEVLREVALQSRSTRSDPEFRQRIAEVNRGMHEHLLQRLAERASGARHPDPAAAAGLALTAVSGAMREILLFSGSAPAWNDAELVDELTELFTRYLGHTP